MINIVNTNQGLKHGIKWGLIIVVIIIGFTAFAKALSFVMNTQLIGIIFTSIFTGVGITIGTYVANKMLIDRMEKMKSLNKKEEIKNE